MFCLCMLWQCKFSVSMVYMICDNCDNNLSLSFPCLGFTCCDNCNGNVPCAGFTCCDNCGSNVSFPCPGFTYCDNYGSNVNFHCPGFTYCDNYGSNVNKCPGFTWYNYVKIAITVSTFSVSRVYTWWQLWQQCSFPCPGFTWWQLWQQCKFSVSRVYMLWQM